MHVVEFGVAMALLHDDLTWFKGPHFAGIVKERVDEGGAAVRGHDASMLTNPSAIARPKGQGFGRAALPGDDDTFNVAGGQRELIDRPRPCGGGI